MDIGDSKARKEGFVSIELVIVLNVIHRFLPKVRNLKNEKEKR
jgi:hypothetical protein